MLVCVPRITGPNETTRCLLNPDHVVWVVPYNHTDFGMVVEIGVKWPNTFEWRINMNLEDFQRMMNQKV